MKVNHFNLKRQAHTLSRSSSDQSWNPFRHVSWDQKPKRSSTWDSGNLESQRDQQLHDEDGEKLTHASTEPGTRGLNRDFSTAETMKTSDERQRDRSPENISPMVGVNGGGGGDHMDISQRSLVDGDGGVRNRKQDETTKPERPTQAEVDNKKKERKKSGIFKKVYPKEPFTFANQLQRTLLNSWINVLLVAAPVGIALNYVP